jgi:hypothetical protein
MPVLYRHKFTSQEILFYAELKRLGKRIDHG